MGNKLQKLFEKISRQCTCSVSIVGSRYGDSRGRYYDKGRFSYDCRIEIESIGNSAEDVVSLLHEQVHNEHENNGCKCMKTSNHMLGEYHAYKEGLQAALKLDNRDVVIKTMNLISGEAIKWCENPHRTAARKVMKLKLWQKALEYIK